MPSWSTQGVYLALETSGAVGSVALAAGRRVVAREFLLRAQEQSRRILPAIQAVLVQARVPMDGISGVVVGAGPGSFTGVRIAAATAKGLVHALRIPLWAVSSLAAGALSDRVLPSGTGVDGWWENAAPGGSAVPRYVLFDARGDRLYAACHEVSPSGRLRTVVPPHATTLEGLLSEKLPEEVDWVGDGAVRHQRRLEASMGRVLGPPAGAPTADSLLYLLAHGDAELIADPAAWEPHYLKPSNAERDGRLFDARPSSS